MTINVCVLHGGKAYVGSDEATSNWDNSSGRNKFTANNISRKMRKFTVGTNHFIVVVSGALVTHNNVKEVVEYVMDSIKNSAFHTLYERVKEIDCTPLKNETYIRVVGRRTISDSTSNYVIVKLDKDANGNCLSPTVTLPLTSPTIVGGGDGWVLADNYLDKIYKAQLHAKSPVSFIYNFSYNNTSLNNIKNAEVVLSELLKNHTNAPEQVIKDILKFYAEFTSIPHSPNGATIEVETLP